MPFNVGDTVWFIGAKPLKCDHCAQDLPDLDFWIEEGLVTAKIESTQGSWPNDEETKKPDYSVKPQTSTLVLYNVLVVGKETYCNLPGACLYSTRPDALKALDDKMVQPVLVKRPETRFQSQVGDFVTLIASDEQNGPLTAE